MRRALAGEFAALDGGSARVTVTLDDREPDDPGPWQIRRVCPTEGSRWIAECVPEHDYVVLIAPETSGILAGLTREVTRSGGRVLGSSAAAIELTGDKRALADHLLGLGIETPPCRMVTPRDGLPRDASYPAVLKPFDGAGTLDTYLVENAHSLPAPARAMPSAMLQPFVGGQPMSASFLVDGSGRPWLICVGEQDIAVPEGCFRYQGGRLPASRAVDVRSPGAAIKAVPGLQGFVGVDFMWDERRGQATILEINPRPTTSIVGILRLLPAGQLAAAWLEAFEPETRRARVLPGLAELIQGNRSRVHFDISGNVWHHEIPV